MIPDLIQYFLTGKVSSESSIASTSQLFDINPQQWSVELIEQLALSPTSFSTISLPFAKVGRFETKDYSIPVHSVIQHDTASAIYTSPTTEDTSYFLSSGTWSVLGKKLNGVELIMDISVTEVFLVNIICKKNSL